MDIARTEVPESHVVAYDEVGVQFSENGGFHFRPPMGVIAEWESLDSLRRAFWLRASGSAYQWENDPASAPNPGRS